MALLEVTDLRTSFATEDGVVRAVDGVTFRLEAGRVLGIVGESGSGKSVTCLSILGLTPKRKTLVTGSAQFKGRDLLKLGDKEMRSVRGAEIAMIFQDPMTSLNPVRTVGFQLTEAIRLHRRVPGAAAEARARDALASVGIPNPAERMKAYPMELSGGMRQRVMIAMALLNEPDLLIADEPTTALDVTTQAQVLGLLRDLRERTSAAVILITHDLGVIADICDDVLVMYAGRPVEQGEVRDIFGNPQHPYTWGLLASLPRMNLGAPRIRTIRGSPPSLLAVPSGCPFHPRCTEAFDRCSVERPNAEPVADGSVHVAACHLTIAER
ncbi:MAG TPA: ABC transporter ATP-binding protein, partial [Candidatus Limnocylindrales bacterium]